MSWYKEGFYWRKPSPQWEIKNYGEAIDSKGDLIFNTLDRIIEQEDYSEWAVISLSLCYGLLKDRIRWPDAMNQDCDSGNWVRWRWSQLLQSVTAKRKWNKEKRKFDRTDTRRVKYRPQGFMTRDPYYPFYLCCLIFGREEWIKEVKIPWYLYRRDGFRDRRRLIRDNSKDYVKKIRYYRDRASVLNYEKKGGV